MVRKKHTIIAGDFNCPDIDWISMSIQKNAQDLTPSPRKNNIKRRKPPKSCLNYKPNPDQINQQHTWYIGSQHCSGRLRYQTILCQAETLEALRVFKGQKGTAESQRQGNFYRNCPARLEPVIYPSPLINLMKAIEANIPSKMKTSKHSIPWITRDVKQALCHKARLY